MKNVSWIEMRSEVQNDIERFQIFWFKSWLNLIQDLKILSRSMRHTKMFILL